MKPWPHVFDHRQAFSIRPSNSAGVSEIRSHDAKEIVTGRERPLRILQVSTFDINGGAEKVAWDLFRTYRARGLDSWLTVGTKRGDDPNVISIPRLSYQNSWSRPWLTLEKRLQSFEGTAYAVCRALLRTLANPAQELGPRLGIEDFNHPGTYRLLELASNKPDVVHCHNLHGDYFDLRVIPSLSWHIPVLLTLHDAWLLSGHCSHSFTCERWKFGCGRCPDLTIYPAIRRDATSYNWRRKRDIFAKSRLYVATPSRWLMQKVEQSVLSAGIKQARVIPYGIDLNVFRPAPKYKARAFLELPEDAEILLFAANGIRRNRFKDYETMREAITRLATHSTRRRLLFMAVGEKLPTERIGQAEVHFVPYQKDPEVIARYYQAADVYLHAAKADTFPNTLLEALACGTPVVATAVGGIPEQVKTLEFTGCGTRPVGMNMCGPDEATGMLTAPGDAETIAIGVERLLNDATLRQRLGQNAAKDARKRFDLQRQVDSYLDWYKELLRANSSRA
jgi:glycosyltransferase involved in cell wall biosynthesis